MDCPGAAPVWGDFQAILHLSLALNAIYAASEVFIEPIIRQDTEAASSELDRMQRDASGNTRNQRRLLWGVWLFMNKVDLYVSQFDHNVIRPLAAISIMVGMAELIYSCYNFHECISTPSSILTCFLLFPFGFAVLFYTALSFYVFVTNTLYSLQEFPK